MQIKYLKAFADNYIWLIEHNQQVIVVDPGASLNVLDYIIAHNLELKAILLTHDHSDHIGGVEDILNYKKVPVYGNCSYATINLSDNQVINIFDGIFLSVVFTPGHTYNSICYLLNDGQSKHLFCGDTLFASGCGRVFTNDYYAMYNSLLKIKALDVDTLVYPAHEYTLKNLEFILNLMPNDDELKSYYQQCLNKYNTIGNTLPTVIREELKFNPFFRLDNPDIKSYVEDKFDVLLTNEYECFKNLRMLRNNF